MTSLTGAPLPARKAVDAEHYCLAIDDELLDPVLERRFHDPRIAIGPVISVARKQARAIALPLHPDAIAVVFDFATGGCGPKAWKRNVAQRMRVKPDATARLWVCPLARKSHRCEHIGAPESAKVVVTQRL
jgi:hypothetical protein